MVNKKIISKRKLYNNLYKITSNNISALEKELNQNTNIEYIQKNYIHEKETIIQAPKDFIEKTQMSNIQKSLFKSSSYFNDKKSSGQWYLKSLSQNGISVSSAYSKNLVEDQKDVLVAVVDTGVDFNHADLENQLWVNPNEIPGDNIDNDNNGYVDDIYGINTLIRDEKGNTTSDPKPGKSGHGTHVA